MSAAAIVANRGVFLNGMLVSYLFVFQQNLFILTFSFYFLFFILDTEPDYNHVSDQEYVTFRKKAQDAYNKRAELSQKSQNAYKQGDKQKAHELSVEANKQLAIAEQFNAKAAEFVFIENNKDSDDNDIDLHGLYVKEAEYILKQRIISGINKHQPTIDCIVGKGLHSKNGVAKLKPAVEQLCNDANLRCWVDKKNSGVLHIDIQNAQIPQSWYNINPSGIGAMDDTYYAYHPNEKPTNNQQYPQTYQPSYQPHQQQHQQQQYHQQPHQQQQQQYHQQQQQQQSQNTDFAMCLFGVFGLLFKSFCR